MHSSFVENDTEVDSLQRRVKAISRELADTQRDHEEAMNAKDHRILAGVSRRDKLQKQIRILTAANNELKHTVKVHSAAASAAESENRTLTLENKRLCRSVERAKQREAELEAELSATSEAVLRMRVKLLCKKYHTDKCGSSTTFGASEIVRDLVALLSDE